MYKYQCIFQCNQINFVQQCIQISTRINSSSVHTYICVCFICIQYSTWCQNRGCSYISSRRRNLQIESSSSLHISKHPEHFYSRITVLLKVSRREEDSVSVQSAIGSRVFRAILPSRIFILSSSKALQAPHVQFPMLPSILPDRNFILCSQRCPTGPCGAPVFAVEKQFYYFTQDKYL